VFEKKITKLVLLFAAVDCATKLDCVLDTSSTSSSPHSSGIGQFHTSMLRNPVLSGWMLLKRAITQLRLHLIKDHLLFYGGYHAVMVGLDWGIEQKIKKEIWATFVKGLHGFLSSQHTSSIYVRGVTGTPLILQDYH
jgi:hypothetical protein